MCVCLCLVWTHCDKYTFGQATNDTRLEFWNTNMEEQLVMDKWTNKQIYVYTLDKL